MPRKKKKSLSEVLHDELAALQAVSPRIKPPLTRDPKTYRVQDATGRVVAYIGPKFWKALKEMP